MPKNKNKVVLEIRNSDVYVWKVLDKKDIEKKVKEAIKKYVKRTGNKPRVFRGSFKLPRIMFNNKMIDLNEKFKGADMVVEFIGYIPYLPYIDVKGDKKVKFIHFPEKEMILVADPQDRDRIYIIHSMRLTEEGLKE